VDSLKKYGILGIDPRAMWMLSKHSATRDMPAVLKKI
jgi:hypothetical protein